MVPRLAQPGNAPNVNNEYVSLPAFFFFIIRTIIDFEIAVVIRIE